ncbi:superoxide dismutase [Candidatus Cyanaurora vandensis]|uniref:superoxide dismutase n=1 Tax=Candidatus Cyanaurora vandensis TaxID=2714958 RepID=UPI00257FA1C6|nr:Fe-Mn family superoxide dismutase [Candidatus Cyanaurora vandensis]
MATSVYEYKATPITLMGLLGLSDDQIKQHEKLYNGYVTNVNKLNSEIARLVDEGKESTPEFAEQKRRLGFEYNGMILHELYFGNMKPNGGELPSASPLYARIVESFGSYENWDKDFKAVAKMRGVGWAIMYQNPTNGLLSNHWVTLHEEGHPAGYIPVLIMDAWEHAFTVDYAPTERPKYIEAFFKNVDWQVCANRLVMLEH